MNATNRGTLLAAALLATLAAAWLAPAAPDEHKAADSSLEAMPTLADWPEPPPPVQAPKTAMAESNSKATAGAAAGHGAPRPEALPLAQAPSTPPPPFRMFGSLSRDGQTVAFLNHAGKTLIVAPGETLPGDWQVGSVGSDGTDLTYLPLGKTVRIPLKASPK